MSYRRKRPRSLPGTNERQTPNVVDQLSFKYMEMCKMGSSTDSESEFSPRWSDTSTLGCVNSAAESGTSRRALSLTHKPVGRHGGSSLFLDPYDGSSEDSEESGLDSSRLMKLQGKGSGGGSRLLGRSRRGAIPTPTSVALKDVAGFARGSVSEQQHPMDVQMKCRSDSELWVCESDDLPSLKNQDGCSNLTEERATELTGHTPNMELQCHSSDIHTEILSVPHKARFQPPGVRSSPKRSPGFCDLRSVYKRKLGLPGADMLEQRKKQCFSMEETDRSRLVRRASSVLESQLQTIQEVVRRTLDNASHPPHDTVGALSSSSSGRLLQPPSKEERCHRSFIPAAVKL